MRASEFYASNYLKAEDLTDDEVFTIKEVEARDFQDDGVKPVLWLRETRKQFIANKTNLKTIKKLYDDDMNKWKGNRIVLFPTSVDFKGEQVLALRVRPWRPKGETDKTESSEETSDEGVTEDDIPFS